MMIYIYIHIYTVFNYIDTYVYTHDIYIYIYEVGGLSRIAALRQKCIMTARAQYVLLIFAVVFEGKSAC